MFFFEFKLLLVWVGLWFLLLVVLRRELFSITGKAEGFSRNFGTLVDKETH